MIRLKLAGAAILALAAVAASAAPAPASRPWEPVPPHRICYLGHVGQPSGCVWVYG